MKTKIKFSLIWFVTIALLISGCQLGTTAPGSGIETEPLPHNAVTEASNPAVTNATPTALPTEGLPAAVDRSTEPAPTAPTAVPTALEPTATQEPADLSVGPDIFPDNINPLTGLPVSDPDMLKLPPALLSISNFPASARPQAGLNTSPFVFEMAIGEGMTRFLAMFYGQYPEMVSGQTEGQASGGAPAGGTSATDGVPSNDMPAETDAGSAASSIGPIRSGRLPYEDLRSIYSGFLVMASAYSGVAQTLNEATSIYGSDSDDINSAMLDVDKLKKIAEFRAEGYPGSEFSLTGMKFSPTPPEGGKAAEQVWVFYSNLNQVRWQYDPDLGAYVRYDIKTDGSNVFEMATDRLSGEPIARENVIVIYAEHNYLAPTLIDIHLTNVPPSRALLFRDGEVHQIFWTTQFGEYEQKTGLLRPMRFVDEAGNPVALKNGYTWVEIISNASYVLEGEMNDHPFYPIKPAEGSGLWLIRYKGRY